MSDTKKLPDEALTEKTFFIMLSLANEPKHGYAIMKEVEALSDERIQLSTGTLYGALNRLLENEWVERIIESGEVSRGRKTYRLTEKGHAILNNEVRRLKNLVTIAQMNQVEG